MRAAGVGKDFKENPNLRDNWTDAEGYYSKCCLHNPYLRLICGLSIVEKTMIPLSQNLLSGLICLVNAVEPFGQYSFFGFCLLRGEYRGDPGQTL